MDLERFELSCRSLDFPISSTSIFIAQSTENNWIEQSGFHLASFSRRFTDHRCYSPLIIDYLWKVVNTFCKIRTCNLILRRNLLYPVELRRYGEGIGTWTLTISFGDWGATNYTIPTDLECLVRIELTMGVLQTPALPLGYRHISNYLVIPDSWSPITESNCSL